MGEMIQVGYDASKLKNTYLMQSTQMLKDYVYVNYRFF
jgi:hypothetical protein